MPTMATASPTTRRVVLLHKTGPLADIYQILGIHDGVVQYPPKLVYKNLLGQPAVANHFKTKPRMLIYREWAQALSTVEMSPAQV